MSEIDLKQENKKLHEQVSVLEQQLQQYQASGPVGYYYEMNRWVSNANEYIKQKAGNIGSLISEESKDFDRLMTLIKSTRDIVESLSTLKTLIGITDNEGKDKEDNWVAGKDFISNVAAKRS